MARPSRRSLLRAGAAVGATATAVLAGVPPWMRPLPAAAQGSVHEVLAALILAEDRAVFLYTRAAAAKNLSPQALTAMVAPYQVHHKDERDALVQKLRGDGGIAPAVDQAYSDLANRLDGLAEPAILAALRDVETLLISAYSGAIPRSRTADLAADLASILGVDAQHLSVLNLALNQAPTSGPVVGAPPS